MPSNLPPGCRVSDLPGNRPDDAAYDQFIEELEDSGRIAGMSAQAIDEEFARRKAAALDHAAEMWAGCYDD